MPSVVVVGLQWGDEGKGKVIDYLSEEADHVVRGQGGNNAGHTVMIGSDEYKLHLIPSGILVPHTLCYIGGGTVIDPAVLLKEIEGLEKRDIELAERLFVSSFAHVIFPYHLELDRLYSLGTIGTTGRGIGPCYTDKVRRLGIRMAELVRPELLQGRLKQVLDIVNKELKEIFKAEPLNFEVIYKNYVGFGEKLFPFVSDFEEKLFTAAKRGDTILFEGAQGTFLDITYGTYPFVTSSSTIASGICAGAGCGPSKIDAVVGVAKAYTTRVGLGPLPTALTSEEETAFLDPRLAREFGTTTGRQRRIGWFDVPLVRRAVALSGVDVLALMKLDVLDMLKEIKICVGYRLGSKEISVPPSVIEDFEAVQPIYETLPGWETSTRECREFEELPENAQRYIQMIETLVGVPLYLISLGPAREETIKIKDMHESACC